MLSLSVLIYEIIYLTDYVPLGTHIHGVPSKTVLRGPQREAIVMLAGEHYISEDCNENK